MSSPVLVISYHYIRQQENIRYPGIHPLAPSKFTFQLDKLRNSSRMISPGSFDEWLAGDRSGEPSVLLTFDDGLQDHWYASKHLEAVGTRGAFFICSRPYLEKKALPVHKIHWLRSSMPDVDFVHAFSATLPDEWKRKLDTPDVALQAAAADTYRFDPPQVGILKFLINFVIPYECVDASTSSMLDEAGTSEVRFCSDTYLTPDQIADMAAAGHRIGCHGHLHKPFSRFEAATLLDDLNTNRDFLAAMLPEKPAWLAYPYGSEWSLPADTALFTRQAGIKAAFTYERGWNTPEVPHDRLRRIDCNEVDTYINSPATS